MVQHQNLFCCIRGVLLSEHAEEESYSDGSVHASGTCLWALQKQAPKPSHSPDWPQLAPGLSIQGFNLWFALFLPSPFPSPSSPFLPCFRIQGLPILFSACSFLLLFPVSSPPPPNFCTILRGSCVFMETTWNCSFHENWKITILVGP